MSFKQDLSDSAKDFLRCVYPTIAEHMGGGELIPIESVTTIDFLKKIDMYSGIDAWQLHTQHGLRGIASRVQWGPFPDYKPTGWGTFTIRYKRSSGAKTEYEKRLSAIESNEGWLYPHFTVQAYIDIRGGEGKLLSAAIIKTELLYKIVSDDIANGFPYKHIKIIPNRFDKNLFIAIEWTELYPYGCAKCM